MPLIFNLGHFPGRRLQKSGPVFAGLFLALFLSCFASALSSMSVPAVDANGQGLLTTIHAEIRPGTGGVYVDVQPFISVETQHSAKIAAEQAAKLAGVDLAKYDVFYKIVANTESVDGPSGGQALALLAYAEFTRKTVRSDLTATGTVEADGSIGKVGGILEKVEAAQAKGVKLVLLPIGQGIQNGVDLTQYAQARWGMQVVEVRNLTESIALAFSPTGSVVTVPSHPEIPLVLENVTSLQTDSVLPLQSLARRQIQLLTDTLPTLDQDSVIAQVLRQATNRTSQLLDNGYYYSAANEAFIAQIQADSYALSNVSKADLLVKLQSLENAMDSYVFVEPTDVNLEWSAGARLRWFWAKERLSDIAERASVADKAAPLLDDYASSLNWFSAAKLLDAQARIVGGRFVAMDSWKADAYRTMATANASVTKNPLDSESLFHLKAGLRALRAGDYLAAAYDAGFATAFTRARTDLLEIEDENLTAILPELSDLKNYSDSAWSQLYFAHGLYSASQANQSGDLLDAVNAVKLADLAQELQQVHSVLLGRVGQPVEPYLGPTVPAQSSSNQNPGISVSTTVQNSGLNPVWFIAGAGFLVVLVLSVMVLVYARRPRDLNKSERLDLLERGLLEGRISEKTYDKLNQKYGVGKTVLVAKSKKKR
ncbi:hypothetical protein HY994_03030 [Candidatus Micrarchaeota archaeon]|nr:hypothetical protein [Candidatus Micrarchaeota archaeon]